MPDRGCGLRPYAQLDIDVTARIPFAEEQSGALRIDVRAVGRYRSFAAEQDTSGLASAGSLAGQAGFRFR